MSPTGEAVHYVASGGSITPRIATDVLYRQAHAPQTVKPTGLDWDALTPTCSSCTAKSGQIDASGLCPTCRGTAATPERTDVDVTDYATYKVLDPEDVTARFTAPTETPQTADDTQVEAMLRIQADYEAAEAADLAAHPAAEPPVVPSPPAVRAKVRQVSPHDVVITLCSTTDPINPVAVSALLADLLAALTQTPVAASPAAAGPPSEGRRPVGKQAAPSDTPTAVIRAWAHTNGVLDLDHRSGRLPAAVRDAYDHAHPTGTTN